MFNQAFEISLNITFTRAENKRHEFITVEHLLLSLLDNSDATRVLTACGANSERLRTVLTQFIDDTTPKIPLNSEQTVQPTLGFQRVLQRAIFQVQSSGNTEVTGANVLAAIFGEQESQAVYFLSQENVTRLDVLNYISHGVSKNAGALPEDSRIEGEDGDGGVAGTSGASALAQFATNLNEKAKIGKIDPVVGREEELMRTVQVLCRRTKNNPLYVGEAGVGKTALAEGLARLIVENKVPDAIKNSTIYALDLGVLLAGTKYRGDFEKRFNSIIKELKQTPGAIVFIDEIHTIIGAGAAAGGAIDASNLLKPSLAKGELRCIGSTTYQEYRNIFEKDRALSRRFQKIDVIEPTVEQTVMILKGLKEHFENYHNVKYTLPALRAAAELSARHINDRFLPDKAIDVVDEAGAYQQLLPEIKRKKTIGLHEIEEIVAKIARIPTKQVSSSDKRILKDLERRLKLLVFGQDPAIEALCAAIKLSRSGLRNPEKPVGSFLFAGPTGVGKTEVTQQLAKALGIELLRFDMSEYMERHTVSRLIGAPPGYVGFDQAGLLTDAVSKHPHAVLLLDEIEKAHPDIYNILLQIMDYGRLTDNNGRIADFRNVILVMTTNAGADLLEKVSIGFAKQDNTTDSMGVIQRLFAPEFRNRLDGIIQFAHLMPDIIESVVNKFLVELEILLEEKSVHMTIEPAAKKWLAEHGYDKGMGARPMERLIQEQLKKPLANELLFGKLVHGGKVTVSVKNSQLTFEINAAKSSSSIENDSDIEIMD